MQQATWAVRSTLIPVGEFDASGNLVDGAGNPVDHPLTGLAITGGNPGDQYFTVELPFGSFVPDQPIADIVIEASLNSSTGAEVGVPLDITATGGFALGCDPLDNPGTDPPIIGTTVVDTVTPTVFDLEKRVLAAETESATGPNYPITYELVVNIANGETVNNIDITDVLPNSFVYIPGSISVSTAAGVVLTGQSFTDVPVGGSPQNSPNNDFLVEFSSVTGTLSDEDVVISYTIFIDAADANAADVLDPLSGDDRGLTNTAQGAGVHSSGPVFDDDDETDQTVDAKSLAIQKDLGIAVDTGAAWCQPW